LVPILAVAFVSISHVATWYGLSNPLNWAIYLSIGIEIAALSALAAISAQMGKKVYFPFGIVTLIQFIGNIFFAYQYIDVSSQSFKDWIDLVDPIVSYLGVESENIVGHKRFLSLLSGGMLPIISLSFLHMLVKFEEEDKKNPTVLPTEIDIDKLSIEAGKIESEFEKDKYTPTEDELKKLEEELIKLNEQKFGSIEEIMKDDNLDNLNLTTTEEIKDDNLDNSDIMTTEEIKDDNLDNSDIMTTEKINQTTWKQKYFPEKKVLNYFRRYA